MPLGIPTTIMFEGFPRPSLDQNLVNVTAERKDGFPDLVCSQILVVELAKNAINPSQTLRE